jgi:putative ABC transport system permease protein
MLGRIAFKNTLKNWRHSLSALLALGAAFVSLVMFEGYMGNVEQISKDQFRHAQMLGDVLIENKGLWSKGGISEPWKFWVTKDEQAAIQKFLENHKTQVNSTVRSIDYQGMVTNGEQSQIFMGRAYDIQEGKKMRGPDFEWNATFGLPLDRTSDIYAAAMGRGLARKMGCILHYSRSFNTPIGGFEPFERPFECTSKEIQISTTTPEGQLNAIDLNLFGTIDGGYKDLDDRVLQTSLEAAQALLDTESVSYVAMELNPGVSAFDFIDSFNQEVGARFPNLHMQRWQDHPFGETYTSTMDFLAIFRNFIIIVILVVSTLSVVNTLVKIVKERTREIGTMRSIGFRSQQVARLFLFESLYLALIGSVIGFVISIVATLAINAVNIQYKAGLLAEPISFHINFVWQGYLTALAMLVTVSLLASYFSTLSILKGKIVDNLVHV